MGKLVYVREKKTKPHEPGMWNEKKRYEAVCYYVSGIPISQIAVEMNIPVATLRTWRTKPWWDDIVKDIQSEDKQKLDAKLTKILDKSLETVMDRLADGEYIYDQKTGKVKRTPVKLRDATVAFNTIMDKRQLIRKEPTKITEQTSSAEQLKNLAEQFASFVGKQKEETPLSVTETFIEGETLTEQPDGSYVLKE
jgi:hypothetical protein